MPNRMSSVIQEVPADRRIPELNGQRVLVTGGAGMIGSHLVARLVAEGASVMVLDNLSSGHRELVLDDPRVSFVEGSVTEPKALEVAFSCKPDTVFHLAALFANQNSVEHPVDDLQVNGVGTVQVLERAVSARVKRFVYASSSCAYSSDVTEMQEDCTQFSYATPYAISKHLGENYCHYYNQFCKLPCTIVRYFNSFGPHEYPGKYRNVIPNFFARAMAGKPLSVHGDGRATRDFTYVEDTVEGTCLAAVRDKAIGQVFNIGTGKETTILDLTTLINRIAANKAGIERIPQRSWDLVMRRHANIKRAREILGFNPRWTLEDGLKKTHEWLRHVLTPNR